MADAEKVLNKATRMLQTKYGIANCTVQVERFDAAAMEICPQCSEFDDWLCVPDVNILNDIPESTFFFVNVCKFVRYYEAQIRDDL